MPWFKLILFDLYGTLAGFDPPRERIQAIAAAEHGYRLDEDGIPAGYREADDFMAMQNGKAPLRTMSRPELDAFFARYEQIILQHAGVEVGVETAGEIWRTVRRQEYGLAPLPDVIPVLDELRGQGRAVGVVSNMSERGDAVAERIGLADHIDFIVTSRDAGANKPHPPIFREALARGNARPEEALLVGDSLNSDIEGALGAGIQPVLIDREAHHGGYTANPRITSMGELLALIRALEAGAP